jgi:hypothetical protein
MQRFVAGEMGVEALVEFLRGHGLEIKLPADGSGSHANSGGERQA